jgi:hypothetical protein
VNTAPGVEVQALAGPFELHSRSACRKAKARGYRTLRNLKAMIYLIAGKLDILAST